MSGAYIYDTRELRYTAVAICRRHLLRRQSATILTKHLFVLQNMLDILIRNICIKGTPEIIPAIAVQIIL
ncbi:hypothetical protein PILCRDRAFT_826719, partial [Piloderma croceum F 1598]